MRLLVLFFGVLFFISCTKEIEVDFPISKKELAIYSTIVPWTLPNPKKLNVNIQLTKDINDTTQKIVNDALVIYEGDGKIDTLSYDNTINGYLINDYPKENSFYNLTVKKDGYETVYSETYIPEKVLIDSFRVQEIAYFNDNGTVYSEITINFKDIANKDNYYELAVSEISFQYDNDESFYRLSSNDNIITSEAYYPALTQLDLKKPKFLLFNDSKINGMDYSLKIYYVPPQFEEEKRYISNHIISIHLRNVSKEYYEFKTSFLQHANNIKEDFFYGMGEPINLNGNIDNALGLFGGFNNDIKSIMIEEMPVEK